MKLLSTWSLRSLLRQLRSAFDSARVLVVLAALLMPIAAPIPAWAYGLDLPKPTVDVSPVKADLSIYSTITAVGSRMITDASNLLSFLPSHAELSEPGSTDNAERARMLEVRVKDIETPVGEATELVIGESIQLSALPVDDNRQPVHGIEPMWISDHPRIVEVRGDRAVAVAKGKATLVVKAGKVSKSSEVVVTEKELVATLTAANTHAKRNTEASTAAPLVEDTEGSVRDSSYTPENNVGSPAKITEMDSPNEASALRIRHRAGVANFSFALPFASIPGRGIDASVGMTYNSRVWNKTGEGTSAHYDFNLDKNWLAPGFTTGYGKLTSHFSSKRIFLTATSQFKTLNEVVPEGFTDSGGTRHQLECKATSPITGAGSYGGAVPTTYCSEYGTLDGTNIRVLYFGSRPISNDFVNDLSAYSTTYFMLVYPDGSKITYSAPGAQFPATDYVRDHYPTLLQDKNGNQINVAYKDGKEKIDYIRDTLGRYIRFHYETASSERLVAVTAPGLDGQDRQTVRFYYAENVPLNYANRFTGTAIGPSTYTALKYVYFPSTGSGYRYDYHSNFGAITKISRLTGMSVSGSSSLTSTGTVDADGSVAASTEYLYPNDGGQTPLTDVPKYTQRTDDWQGRNTSVAAPVTYYDAPEAVAGYDQTSTVTVPGTDFDVEYKSVLNNTTDWKNGLTKETSVIKRYGPAPSRPYSAVMAKTVYSWDQGVADSTGRRIPIVTTLETTNDAGQTRANTFSYDSHNNPIVVREHDFAPPGILGAELRRTETAYIEEGTGWANNRMYHLPREVKTFVGSTVVSKTVYEYDGNAMAATPGVIQHNSDYDPNSGTHQCGQHYECDPGDNPPHCPLVPDYCPNHDPATDFRGNVTKVTSFANPALSSDPDASVKTISYDITGNVVTASMSCCNIKTTEYAASNYYAYPTKETKGSTTQLVTKAEYNFHTGLMTKAFDENNVETDLAYDPATLRNTRIDYPNGAWLTRDYNDTQFPYSVKTTSSLDTSRSIASWSYFNGAGQAFRTRSLTASGYISNDIDFDNLGRAIKTFNPYTVASLADARPPGIKSTEVTSIDAIGRVLTTRYADNTTATVEFNTASNTPAGYNRTFVTVTDQAGKKRRQLIDALGRIRRADEPGTNGNLDSGSIDSPLQPTVYEYDGNDNLTMVTQTEGGVVQERVFEYDSLSRLLRERQVEAIPTLDAAGIKGSPSSSKWTGVYKYTEDGLLDWAVDPRGVKSDFTYDGLNRIKEIEYIGENGYVTPKTVYTYGEVRNDSNNQPYQNTGRLTTVETLENAGQGTPKTIHKYDYDSVGQIKRHIQTIGTSDYSLEYGYNLAGQVVSEKYPSGKVVNMTVDNFGVTQTVADAQRTYVSGVTVAYTSIGMTSQTTLGNGTVENFTFNERFQLTSQNLMRGSEVLQKSDYTYGRMDGSGNVDTTKNNGQLAKIEAFIGAAKQRTQKFTYDSIGRLAKSEEYRGDTNALTYKQIFDYDRFGNLYRKAASNPTAGQQNPIPFTAIEESSAPNTGDIDKSTNRFRTGTTYDEAGQVISDTKFRNMNFAYDANGRMVNVHSLSSPTSPDSKTIYDALGNRVATKINDVWQYMIYDAFGQLVAEYGTPSDGAGGVKFIQQDHQGSVRTITNAFGFVVSRTDHQAFGEDIGAYIGQRTIEQGYASDSVTRQGYGLTEKDDATGQQHTWFRKLEPKAGRWSTADPYKGSMSIGDPQSFNRYSYVNNQPTNFVDPKGLLMQVCELRGGEILCRGTGESYYGADRGYLPTSVTITEYRQYAGWDGSAIYNHFSTTSFSYGGSFGGFSGRGRECNDIGKVVRMPMIQSTIENVWAKSTGAVKQEIGAVVAFNDDLRLYEVPKYVEGDRGSVNVTQVALEWIASSNIVSWGTTNNIGFEFIIHSHPNRAGDPVPGKPGATYADPNFASDADIRNFSKLKVGRPFALIVTETNVIAYNASNKQLCKFAR